MRTDGLPRPVLRALAPVRRERAARRFATPGLRRRYPATEEALRASGLLDAWWYYSAELLPGVQAAGVHPPDMPMLPRLLLRRCDVAGQDCLDVGTMEGLVPVLLRRRGAGAVLAVDFSHDALPRLAAVQHYHRAEFDFRSVGLMYGLARELRGRSFDLVNLSGLLYHLLSPLSVLAAARELLRPGGLLVLSTWVSLDPDPVMDFNARGRLFSEGNTFWFPSVALVDYVLRYLRLMPLDCLFLPDTELRGPEHAARGRAFGSDFTKAAGYLSVVCRAVDRLDADPWMTESASTSWEYRGLVDWAAADRHPRSSIAYDAAHEAQGGLALDEAVRTAAPVRPPVAVDDAHVLRLDARW